ncbi:hypothetical protein HanPI659440_Chr08g0301771 [Helianthus annuus]|nr:hypothetical protein HanPI659440_Chr08g0301771 [Helianthus annuus]
MFSLVRFSLSLLFLSLSLSSAEWWWVDGACFRYVGVVVRRQRWWFRSAGVVGVRGCWCGMVVGGDGGSDLPIAILLRPSGDENLIGGHVRERVGESESEWRVHSVSFIYGEEGNILHKRISILLL